MSSIQNVKGRWVVFSDFKEKGNSIILTIAGSVRVVIQLSPVYNFNFIFINRCILYERLIYVRIFFVVSCPQFFYNNNA